MVQLFYILLFTEPSSDGRFCCFHNLRGGVTLDRKLNIRQRRFAELYAQTGNTVQSAIKAGYSENYANANACKLLENVRVSEYIRELTDKAKDERIMGVKDRQVALSEIAKNVVNDPIDRIRAIDTLNKMTGEYLQKVEFNGSVKSETSKLSELVKQMKE